jgi:hypothetical protein
MSVIAKMNVANVREFGDGTLINLSCVYEHDGLNTEAWEDRRFTKATPWGEGQLTTPHALEFEQGKPFYLVFHEADTYPAYRPCDGCALAMFVKVRRIEPWPKTVQLEVVKDKTVDDSVTKSTSLNLRMAIDNPAASDQFVDGKRYYLCFYPAERVSLHDAAAGRE